MLERLVTEDSAHRAVFLAFCVGGLISGTIMFIAASVLWAVVLR